MKRFPPLYRHGPAVLAAWAGAVSAAPLTFNTAYPFPRTNGFCVSSSCS